MLKWKYHFRMVTSLGNRRGEAEKFVKQHYEKKGWSVFDSSWSGYRILVTDQFRTQFPLDDKQNHILSFLQTKLTKEQQFRLKPLLCIKKGLPDFMLISNSRTRSNKNLSIKFVEVKSDHDGLSYEQIKMATELTKLGFSTTIFFVLSEPTKSPRVSKKLKDEDNIKNNHPLLETGRKEI